jgi:hypothetical protein
MVRQIPRCGRALAGRHPRAALLTMQHPNKTTSPFASGPFAVGAIQSEGQISEKMSHLDIVQIWKVYS